LGVCGAAMIQQALREQGHTHPPSVRTINRILRRRGALDGRTRVRRPPRREAGICPIWPRAERNWTASTLSRDWSSRTGRRSRSSTACHRTVACRCPGRWSPL
jgi:hypothetical protein